MSLRKKFAGTGIAVITPFNEDFTIDWKSYARLVDFWIDGGIDYLVVLGTTGESATIHGDEKQELFSFISRQVNGRVPLVAGIGGNDTAAVLEGFRTFDLAGYDAILSVAPYYNKPNQEGLVRHYQLLDKHTPLPLIMYNVPGRTGQNMTAATQLRIAETSSNIFATKEASGNLDQIGQIIRDKPAGFLVISGDDALTLPMIALGADGVTSVVANAYPKGFSDMVRLSLAHKFDEARKLHYRYTPVISTMFEEGSPAGVKAYLSEMGLCRNVSRMPVWNVGEQLHERIRSLIKEVGE